MRTLKDNLKDVLCDLVLSGTWEQAYEELIGVLQENMADLQTRGEELANQLKSNGKSDSYIHFRLDPFRIAYERELLSLHTVRELRSEGYRG